MDLVVKEYIFVFNSPSTRRPDVGMSASVPKRAWVEFFYSLSSKSEFKDVLSLYLTT